MTEVEAALWGPAIGAAIAFVAVGLQLFHSSRQREAEREWNSRIEIYLKAIEATAVQSSILANYAHVRPGDAEAAISPKEVSGALQKAVVVASLETAEKITEAEATFYDAISPCSLLRFDLVALQQRAQNVMSGVELRQKSIQENTSKLSADIRDHPHLVNEELLKMFEQHNNELQGQVDRELSLHAELLDQQQAKQFELVKASREAHVQYFRKLVDVYLAIRGELDLKIDKKRFAEAIEKVLSSAKCAQVQLSKHVEKALSA